VSGSVSRAQVRSFRVRAQQLQRAPGDPAATLAATDVLDIGVQDTGPDGGTWALAIRGVDRLCGRELSSFNDHRVLMTLAIAATRANGPTHLTYPHAYRISYPEFLDAMNGIGANMECVS